MPKKLLNLTPALLFSIYLVYLVYLCINYSKIPIYDDEYIHVKLRSLGIYGELIIP